MIVVLTLVCAVGGVDAQRRQKQKKQRQQMQSVYVIDEAARVARNARVTYGDLLKKLLLPGEAQAGRTVPLRQFYDMQKKIAYTGVTDVSFREGMRMQTGDKKYFLAIIEISPKEVVEGMRDKETEINGEKKLTFPTMALALFRIAPQPELLDAAEFQGSVLNSLKADNLQSYFWLIAGYQNCLTEYDDYSLLKIENEQLRMVYNDLPMLSTSTDCSRRISQRPVIALAAGNGTSPIVNLTVVSAVKQYDEACTGQLVRRYTRYFRYKLSWDERQNKYVAQTNADKAIHTELVKYGLAFDEEPQQEQ